MRPITSRTSNGWRMSAGTTPCSSAGSSAGSAGSRRSHGSGGGSPRWRTISRQIAMRVLVVGGQVVGDAREPAVDVGAAQLLGGHLLACRGLHERRPAEEDRAGAAHDHRLVGHGRDVRAAGRARPHDEGDLGDPERRHARLVVEDAAEVLAVGEDVRLERQVRPAGVGQVDAGEPVLLGDLLGAQVLLHGEREVAPALHGRVVRDDDARAARRPGRRRSRCPRPAPRRRRGRGPRAVRAPERRRRDRRAARSARGRAACRASCGAHGVRAAAGPGPLELGLEVADQLAASARGFGGSHPRRCRDDSRCGARAVRLP